MVIDQSLKALEVEQPVPPALELPVGAQDESKRSTFLTKEILDRIGYGLASQQFLNVLFVQSGASLFLVGVINGLKVMSSVVVSYLLERHQLSTKANRFFMMIVGLLFGVSIFTTTVALAMKSIPLFVLSTVFASVIAVCYGTLYQDWFRAHLEMRKRGFLLSRISYYGLGITGISMLAGAFLADRFTNGQTLAFAALGYNVRLQGFVAALIMAALIFMFSALIMLLIGDRSRKKIAPRPLPTVTSATWKELFSSRVLIILFIASATISIVQTLATAYYGIFIYQYFNHSGFGGFMNVAAIFLIALLTSIVGPLIAQYNARAYGKFPMLVFGTLLIAIGPVTYYYNPNLLSISVAMFLSTIGSAICGVSFGLLTIEFVREDRKASFAQLSNLLTLIPYALFIPLGSYVAQSFGMPTLFLALSVGLITVTLPLYLLVIFVSNTRSQKI